MSSSKPTGGGYNPAPQSQMTVAEYQGLQDFFFGQVERFKKMFEDSSLAKYIIMAGVSGVVVALIELVRAIIDVVCYLKK